MSKIIDADPAELTMAGLQRDFWAKYQSGQITLDHLRWLLKLSRAERDRLSGGASSGDKGPFVLLATVPLTVPAKFVHETQIASFCRARGREFDYINPAVTDANFARATQQLVPGRTYQVKFFGITRRVTSDDCLGLYKSHNGILTGAQGPSLAYQEIRGSFPVGRRIASFDEKDALWADSDSYHCVPCVRPLSDDAFSFILIRFEGGFNDDDCALVFCDLSA